ncbi:MAG: PIN domain-containing protein [Chitinophagaceae bacterium]|nr:PIN domain-containing protein [Chitinophagaceae bacterium]
MRVIVDANIVFSAILNSKGKIGDLLINSRKYLEFIAPDFLRQEIFEHYPRLCEISGMTLEQVRESEFQICKGITFISEEQISLSIWLESEKLLADIDPKDTQYIAYSKHFRCKIWSGDKALMKGLYKTGFVNFITTDDLFNWRADKEGNG